MLLIALICLAIALLTLVLRKTYGALPVAELKRQAAAGNASARQLYRVVAYGDSWRLLLWLILAVSSATGLVLLSRDMPLFLAILAVALLLAVGISWLPATRVTMVGMRLSSLCTPLLCWVLNYVDRPLQQLAELLTRRLLPQHSGLFETSDLLDLLDLQAAQPDNRITPEELTLVRRILAFSDQTVLDVLRPRSAVKVVCAEDAIGPILLDELHAAEQPAFLVKPKPRSKEFVGMLLLDRIDIHTSAKIGDIMAPAPETILDTTPLSAALRRLQGHTLLAVVDDDGEFMGTLSLAEIVAHLFGPSVVEEPVTEIVENPEAHE